MSENTIISIKHLRKEYAKVVPLKDVNVEIHKGDVISIIGPSGTGKSTLLRCINRLETPTSGEIWVGDTNVCDPKANLNKIRQKLGMVFQSFNLFSHKTVIENVMMAPIDLRGLSRQQAYEEGIELLKLVGLESKAMNYPDELSGGQKQRVAIARTLAMKPEIILFDEPTSALDPTMVSEVLSVISNLAKNGMTMMIVTHEMRFARDVSSRILYLDDGIVYDDDVPSVIFGNPKKEKTRAFIFRIKDWNYEVDVPDFDFLQMMSDFEVFCARQFLSRKQIMQMNITFEEILRQNIGKISAMRFSCGENGMQASLELDYGRSDSKPIISENNEELSQMILQKYLTLKADNEASKKLVFEVQL